MKKKRIWMIALVVLVLATAACTCSSITDLASGGGISTGGGGGNYGDAPTGGDSYDTTYVGQISVGSSVTDNVPTLLEAHNWEFFGTAGQTVTIRADAIGDSDPRIKLIDPSGNVIAEDDDGGGGYSSLLTATLPSDGTYTIRVDMFSAGDFTLSVQ